jgi:predicted Zn finger-like uncharacterized protein
VEIAAMPISVTCPSCQAPYFLADQLAGKKVKCQKCQGAIDVPLASAAAPPTIPADAAVTAAKPKSVKLKKRAAAKDDPVEDASPFSLPSQPGSSTKAKKGGCSGLMIAIFLFLGFGLLGCGGIAGVVWWLYDAGQTQLAELKDGGIIAIPDDKAADKKKTEQSDPEKDKTKKKDDGKDNPVVEPKKDDAKKEPPVDPKKDEAKKDKTPVEPKKDAAKEKVKPPPPGITTITLGKDGVGRVEGVLSDDDPPNPFSGRPHKAYQVQLEAGKNYQFDLVSTDFDTFLFLLDAKNKKITEDENGGGPRNARIIYQAVASDAFRIHVTHFDKKSGKFTLTVRRTEPGVVVKNPDPPANMADVSARVIAFRDDSLLVASLVWARDGKSFYAVDQKGLLTRVNTATGETLKKQDYATRCAHLAMSGEGLLLAMPDAKQVWVVDPENLETIKKKIPVNAPAQHVSAGVDAKFAVVGGAEFSAQGGVEVVDLQKGEVGRSYKTLPLKNFKVAPNGQFLLGQVGQTLRRFRLSGDNLADDDLPSYAIADNPLFFGKVCISPDSQFACLALTRGNTGDHPEHPPAAPDRQRTFVYAVGNPADTKCLQRPALTIDAPFAPEFNAVGIDPRHGFIYVHDRDYALILYSFAGVKIAQAKIANFNAAAISEMAVAPTGGEVLLGGPKQVAYVKINTKGAPVALAEPKKEPEPKKDPVVKKDPEPKKDPIVVKKEPPKPAAEIEAKDVTHRVIVFKAGEGPLRSPVWAADGKSFYVLCKNGAVQRINADSGAVEKTYNIGRAPGDDARLAISAAGLVVSHPGQILVIDLELAGNKRPPINSSEITNVAVGRDSSFAVLAGRGAGPSLRILDLQKEKGGLVGATAIKFPTINMKLSADGKYVVLADNGRILRYRVEGGNLIFEEHSPPVVGPPGLLNISGDGKFVCLAGAVAAQTPANHPEHGLYVYAIDELKKPAVVLTKIDPGRAVGVDVAGGWIYANEAKKPLVIFSATGERKGEFALPVESNAITEYVISPLGRAFLIRTPTSIVHVKIDAMGGS